MVARSAVLLTLALGAVGPAVQTWTGTTPPSGPCVGERVVATTGNPSSTYCCVTGTWTDCTAASSGGAPTNAQYWTGAADATLSAEKNLGALATGLVLNTGGVPSAYAGATCTTPNLIQTLSGSGAPSCYQLKLDDLANPGANKSFTMANKTLTFTYQAPSGADGAFELEATGGYSGDLLHVHQHTGSPVAGTDLIHAEATSTNVLPLRLTAATTGTLAADISGTVTASGFTGPLTGNASTATALAADPSDCAANRYGTGIAASGNLSCSQVTMAGLSATGTPDNTTYLRGDGTWTTPTFIGYTNIYDETTPLTARANLKFTGTGVTCTDSVPYTVCDIPSGGASNATTSTPGVVLAHATPYGTVTALVRTAATNQWDAGASSVMKATSFDASGYSGGTVRAVDLYASSVASTGSRVESGRIIYQGSIWDPSGPSAAVAYGKSDWIPTADNGAGQATAGTYRWYKTQGASVAFTITDTGSFSGNAATASALATTGTTSQFWRGDNTWATPGGGGSPGGSSGQIQYNNGGSFGGAAQTGIDASGNITLPGVAEPTAPSSGVTVFSEDRGDISMFAYIGKQGFDRYAQSHLGFDNIAMMFPAGGATGTTAPSVIGMTVTHEGTTIANPQPGAVSFYNSATRITSTSGTTAGNAAGWRAGSLRYWRGNGALLGGFHCHYRWCNNAATASNRGFIGLSNSVAARANQNPSSDTNFLGAFWDSTDASIQLGGNDGTGTGAETKVTSCSSTDFPPRTADHCFSLDLVAKRNASQVTAYLKRLDTSGLTPCTATISAATNLPSSTTFLAPRIHFQTTTTTATGVGVIKMYCEQDN